MIHAETLGLQDGNKVLEVRDTRVNKGFAALSFIQNQDFDYIFAAGDDYTDEDLFSALPSDAVTVKIGFDNTNAAYFLKSWQSMRMILKRFAYLSNISR
jgi:trehalose 6-phosphate synthase/phosphatase